MSVSIYIILVSYILAVNPFSNVVGLSRFCGETLNPVIMYLFTLGSLFLYLFSKLILAWVKAVYACLPYAPPILWHKFASKVFHRFAAFILIMPIFIIQEET